MKSRYRPKPSTKRCMALPTACFLVALSHVVGQTAPTSQPAVTTKVVFTRPLDDGLNLVVKSTELAVTPELQQSLRGWLESDYIPRVFVFELRLPDGTVFPMCSLPYGDHKVTPSANRWKIVDVIRIGDSIIFASYHNPDMMMVRYNMDSGETERDNLGNGTWNNYSVPVKLRGTIKLSLNKNNDGLCTVEVIYDEPGSRRITHFVAMKDRWKLRMTDEKDIDLSNVGNPAK